MGQVKLKKKGFQKQLVTKLTLVFMRNSALREKFNYYFQGLFCYNLEQKVADKFTKLSKIDFSMDCFTADFLRRFTKKRQNLVFGRTSGYSPSDPSILGIFLKFRNFVRS